MTLEILGLLGPNGAGKTTIMRTIVGLITINEGTVKVCGSSITTDKKSGLEHVGAIIENPEFYNYMTGWQNLIQSARMNKQQYISDDVIEEVVQQVQLSNVIHNKVRTYSLGMRQRLGLAQALIKKPKLLILDEPTNGLDPEGVRDLRILLKELSAKGVSIVISSHLLSEIEKSVTRVLFIENGLIIKDESLKMILQNERIVKVYTSDNHKAKESITKIPYSFKEAGGALFVNIGNHDMSLLIKQLTKEGIDIYEIQYESHKLEDSFMDIIKNEK